MSINQYPSLNLEFHSPRSLNKAIEEGVISCRILSFIIECNDKAPTFASLIDRAPDNLIPPMQSLIDFFGSQIIDMRLVRDKQYQYQVTLFKSTGKFTASGVVPASSMPFELSQSHSFELEIAKNQKITSRPLSEYNAVISNTRANNDDPLFNIFPDRLITIGTFNC